MCNALRVLNESPFSSLSLSPHAVFICLVKESRSPSFSPTFSSLPTLLPVSQLRDLSFQFFSFYAFVYIYIYHILFSNHKNSSLGPPGGPVAKNCSPNAGGLGSIPDQGTRSRMPQLRVGMLRLQIPHVTVKTDDLTYCS